MRKSENDCGSSLRNVLFLSRNLPPLVGGMERLMAHTYQCLDAGYRVTLFGPVGSCGLTRPGDTCRELPNAPVSFVGHALWQGIRDYQRQRYDLILAGNGLMAAAGALLKPLYRCPLVGFVHGLDLVAERFAYQLIVPPLLGRVDRVICNSGNTRSLALSKGVSEDRIRIIHPGTQIPETLDHDLSQTFRDAHGLGGDTPILLSVGRMAPRKGLVEFVRNVLPLIVEAVPAVRLVVVGDDPLSGTSYHRGCQGELVGLCHQLGFEERVLFLGRVTDAELESVYIAADALVLPLTEVPGDVEGFGMVAVEAAAFGVPTVAFALGGVVDAVEPGRSGFLVEPGNYVDFAAACARVLLGHPWSRGDVRHFARRFSWERFRREFHAVLNELFAS